MSDFAAELARLMAARGIGVRELARMMPCNPGHISNLRSGKARPSPELAETLDERLAADGMLRALAPARPPSKHKLTPGRDDGAIADQIAALDLVRQAEASQVGGGTVERLELVVDDLATAYPGTPAAVLLDRVRGYLGYVSRLLDAKTTLAEHRRLLVVGGWLSLLAATTLIDLHRDARRRGAPAYRRAAGPRDRTRRDRRLVLGDPGVAGTDRRGLPAGSGHFPGGTADRPEVRQRVHPGDRAGRPCLGQARRRPPDPGHAQPCRGAGLTAAGARPARAPLPVRPAQSAVLCRHHAVLAR